MSVERSFVGQAVLESWSGGVLECSANLELQPASAGLGVFSGRDRFEQLTQGEKPDSARPTSRPVIWLFDA